jgi:FKBP-type peptidyl-prolyl cis-trans isomerase
MDEANGQASAQDEPVEEVGEVAKGPDPKTSGGRNVLPVIIAVFIVIIIGVAVFYQMKGTSSNNSNNQVTSASQAEVTPGATVNATTSASSQTQAAPVSELKIEDLKIGSGAAVKKGDKVIVDYVGTLTDGTKFDSSNDHNIDFTFTVGAGEVIAGWDQGLIGMKVGGSRKLTIPPALGYGDRAVGPIPANSTLIFTIDLLKIE